MQLLSQALCTGREIIKVMQFVGSLSFFLFLNGTSKKQERPSLINCLNCREFLKSKLTLLQTMPLVSPRGPQTFLSIWRIYPPESSSVCPVLHLRTYQHCKPLRWEALTSTYYLQIFLGSTVLLAEDGDGCFTCRDIQELWKEGLHPPQTTTQPLCWFSAWHLRQASVTCISWHIYYTPSPGL